MVGITRHGVTTQPASSVTEPSSTSAVLPEKVVSDATIDGRSAVNSVYLERLMRLEATALERCGPQPPQPTSLADLDSVRTLGEAQVAWTLCKQSLTPILGEPLTSEETEKIDAGIAAQRSRVVSELCRGNTTHLRITVVLTDTERQAEEIACP